MGLVPRPLQSWSAGPVRSSRMGLADPGTNTSSSRFASAMTATRGRSSSSIAASAAAS